MSEEKIKLEFDLIPVEFDDLALVAMFGAKKYSPRGWEEGVDRDKNLASVRRHENSYKGGEMFDSESGLHHCLHGAFRLLMQYTLDKRKLEEQQDNCPIVSDHGPCDGTGNHSTSKTVDIETKYERTLYTFKDGSSIVQGGGG